MIKLETLQGIKISTGIKSLSPTSFEGIRIENKLLDGSKHVQIIGDPQKYFNFEILSNHLQVNIINNAYSINEMLKLIIDDKFYKGYISEHSWVRITVRHKIESNRYYTCSLRFDISEEGSI